MKSFNRRFLTACVAFVIGVGATNAQPAANNASASKAKLARHLKSAIEAMENNDTPGALKHVLEAALIDPRNKDVYITAAMVQSKAGKHGEAKAEALEVIRLAPKDADGYRLLAAAHLNLKEYGQAVKAVATALKFEPKHKPTLLLAADIMDKSGKPEMAVSYRSDANKVTQ